MGAQVNKNGTKQCSGKKSIPVVQCSARSAVFYLEFSFSSFLLFIFYSRLSNISLFAGIKTRDTRTTRELLYKD